MLFSLTSVGDEGVLIEAADSFMDMLKKSLRETDIMFQVKPGEFFALLPDISEEEAEKIRKGLMDAWEQERYHDKVSVGFSTEFVPFNEL